MLTIACVLKSGGLYTAQWVDRLKAQVAKHLSIEHRFICFSDVPVSCSRIMLERDWPGWWSKIEMLHLPGPVLFFDLDTLILGDLTEIAAAVLDHDLIMLRDFYRPAGLGSGIMAWRSSAGALLSAFAANAEVLMETHRQGGDQAFIETQVDLGRVTRWQNILPGQVVSYKADHCELQPPAAARVLCLHGKPKFGDLPKTNWARTAWEKAA